MLGLGTKQEVRYGWGLFLSTPITITSFLLPCFPSNLPPLPFPPLFLKNPCVFLKCLLPLSFDNTTSAYYRSRQTSAEQSESSLAPHTPALSRLSFAVPSSPPPRLCPPPLFTHPFIAILHSRLLSPTKRLWLL